MNKESNTKVDLRTKGSVNHHCKDPNLSNNSFLSNALMSSELQVDNPPARPAADSHQVIIEDALELNATAVRGGGGARGGARGGGGGSARWGTKAVELWVNGAGGREEDRAVEQEQRGSTALHTVRGGSSHTPWRCHTHNIAA